MKNIIDADAAKLAGLQIDTLSKFRAGKITLEQWEQFNNLSPQDREFCFGKVEKPKPVSPAKPEKFVLLADLGEIKVPDDFDQAIWLAKFREQNHKKFHCYNDDITDENFANPTRILKPGDKLHVRAFKQVVSGTTTSEERLAFLSTQKAVLTGAQGASLVFDQKRDQLQKGKYYASFDEKDRLPFADGYHWVPFVNRYSDGDWSFYLVDFENDWDGDNCLLCFCDVE